MNCLYITPELKKLKSSFKEESLASVRNMVGIWQEREIMNGNDNVTIDSVPDVDTLRALYEDVRKSDDLKIKLSKDEFNSILDDGELPKSLVELAARFNIKMAINKRSHTIDFSTSFATSEDFRLFKTLAIELVYPDNDAISDAFGMSPRERLAAIIDWERKNRNNRHNISVMNYELQLAKQSLRDNYDISTDGVMEAYRKQAAEDFNSTERMERISEVADWFDKILTQFHEDKLQEFADRRSQLQKYIEDKDSQDFPSWDDALAAYQAELGDIQQKQGSYTRLNALQEYGPKAIFDAIKQKYANVAAKSGESDSAFIEALHDEFNVPRNFAKRNIDWYKSQVNKVVDNFIVLSYEACKTIEHTELVKINIYNDDSVDTSESKLHEEENTNGEEENDVNGIENQYRENWMYEYNTTSNLYKMSARIRKLLYKCPLGTGRQNRKTAFCTQYYVPVMEVINTLIREMQGVFNRRDMMLMLESIKGDYSWVQHVIDEIKDSPRLKTELYRSIRRAQQNLGIIERSSNYNDRNDLTKAKLRIVNSGNTITSIYGAVQRQLASGVPLNSKLSIYDGTSISQDKIDKVLSIFEKYSDEEGQEIVEATPDEVSELRKKYPELIKDLHSALTAIGFAVTEEEIRLISARDTKKGVYRQKNNLGVLLSNIELALKQISNNGYTNVDSLLNERKDVVNKSAMAYFKKLADTLTLYDSGTTETSIRENGKSFYSNVLPSILDDLIVGLQGKAFKGLDSRGKRVNKSISEFIEEKYGRDPRFAYRDEDGNLHYRNYILEELANGETGIGTYGPSYVTILNQDVSGRDKVEQKNLTQTDRLNSMWAMYNMGGTGYDNVDGHWFNIILPSDSGRMAYIRFVPIGDDEERLEIIKRAILKELERMTDDENDAYLPETYRKNKGKFCTFPLLNNPELVDGMSVEDILSAYNDALDAGQTMKFDGTVLETLAKAVVDAMHKKFAEENRAFYDARVKEQGEDEVNTIIEETSIFQMALNELLNGDPAYYTGYNSGSDNIQKRAKQVIVPLDHPDIFNEDFLEAYKEYHGIEQDEELDEDDITEHCLYIKDPTMPSPSYNDLEKLYHGALDDGIIDQETYDAFIKSISDIKHTDGQSFRSFDSMVMMMYALGEMEKGDELDLALHRIAEGKQQPGDEFIVRTALKPFLSGLVPIEVGDGSEVRLMPVQHKLSEQVLTAALIQASRTKLGSSPALKALAELMEEQHIDVAIFTSGVKVGQNGAVDFGDVDPESASKDDIKNRMYESMEKYREDTGYSLVHQIPYSLYGIVAQNPDSGLDESTIPIGTQLQKLLPADLPETIKTRYFDGEKWQTRNEEAKYWVDGVGELTRKEILSLYYKLMTQKILNAYKEVTGVFASKEELSKALMRSCRNSSRNSAYLERAFSLDEYGNFVIPLCDLATLNMSSEFLNSIVKNAVSRISAPGKQLVAMSAFGIANQLKVEFEYDDDGNPIRYESIDCMLPAWSRHIIAKCVNENGIIDFSKLENESPELCKMIGSRIPTQFKNFILPLKCVDFLPPILGDTIILAIDSVSLQDADFDNDKVPTIFPSFKADYYVDDWEKKAESEYREYFDKYYDFKAIEKDYRSYMAQNKKAGLDVVGYTLSNFMGEVLNSPESEPKYRRKDAPEGKPMLKDEYIESIKENYRRPDGPKLTYEKFDPEIPIEQQTDGALNNGIINVMRGMLTGKAVSTMSLAVGDTKMLKPIKELIERNTKPNTYPDSPSDIATRIGQETRNNDGKQMIAVFANAESMQAILQHTLVALKEGVGVTINGRTLHSLHDVKIENSLKYISRYIGTALGAAADNAKDPILSVMNINLKTAPVVSLMLQLGYTMEEVAVFLNIPSIRHYTSFGNVGDYEVDMNNLPQVLPGDINDMLKAIRFGDDYEDMEDYMAEYCNTALGVYLYLNSLGERLRKLSSLVRGDSGSSAPHGPIENNLARLISMELFQEEEEVEPVFENWKDVIDYEYGIDKSIGEVNSAPNPLAQAYITYGVVGAFDELSNYYPGISDPNFRNQIKNIIRKYYNGAATPANVKNVLYSLYTYIESSFDCMRKGDMSFAESRNWYLNYFPEEAAMTLAKYSSIAKSLLFRRLRLFSNIESDDPFISLEYDGVMLEEMRDEFTTVWQQLFYAKDENGKPIRELRDLALDLFKYCFFRNGFRFSSGTFAHLAPAEARLMFPGYVQMLDAMQGRFLPEFYDNFEMQFVRNNMYDKRFCQTVPTKPMTVKPDNWLGKDGTPNDFLKIKHRSKMDETHQAAFNWYFNNDENQDVPRTAFVITQINNGKVNYYYYVKVSDNFVTGESTYALTTPLGWKDKAVEYSAKEPGVTMLSVYDQSEVAESLRPKKKRRNGKKHSSSVNVSTGFERNSNSSEAPNESEDESDDEMYKGYLTSTFSGVGYKEVLMLYSDLAKDKKFQDARKEYLKAKKAGKIKPKKSEAKSKSQVKRKKDGGNNNKKIKIVPVNDSIGTISKAEEKCAEEFGAYTIGIMDNDSEQLGSMLRSFTDSAHWVGALFESGNAKAIANELFRKIYKKKVKSIVLNLTGSNINSISKYASQNDIDSYVLNIYRALKDKGIYISKVVSTAQPGVALASARAAIKLGYNLEVRPTNDYKVYGQDGEITSDKDAFLNNLNAGNRIESGKSTRIYDKDDGPFIFASNPWTREIVSKDKNTLYVFTDNTQRRSGTNRVSDTSWYAKKYGIMLTYPGSTSAVIRGLENAFPISTQKTYSPGNYSAGNWNDSDIKEFKKVISAEIDDIIEAFKSGKYKRVVLPAGGLFGRRISNITKERAPKIYEELNKQLTRLQDAINELSESDNINTEVDENQVNRGYNTDDNDILSNDDIQLTDITSPDMGNSNVFVINLDDAAASKGAVLYSKSGNKILDSKIYIVLTKRNGKKIDTRSLSENFQNAKIYSGDGVRITDDIYFTLKKTGTVKYDLLKSAKGVIAFVVDQGLASPVILTNKRPFNKSGLTWLDDNNEPICKG